MHSSDPSSPSPLPLPLLLLSPPPLFPPPPFSILSPAPIFYILLLCRFLCELCIDYSCYADGIWQRVQYVMCVYVGFSNKEFFCNGWNLKMSPSHAKSNTRNKYIRDNNAWFLLHIVFITEGIEQEYVRGRYFTYWYVHCTVMLWLLSLQQLKCCLS
jgi:hypothetical protein